MATHNLLLLPGDGIGPEVMAEVKRLIEFFNAKGPNKLATEEGLVGGSCYDAHQVAITDKTMEKAKAADAVIFGAVGRPNGTRCPMTRGRKRACYACAKTSRSTPICARR